MTSNSIPPPLRDLLSKLEFLGMLECGYKPCMNDMTFVSSSSWWGAFKRTMEGENRKSMMLHINNIVDQALEAIREYNGTEFLVLLINTLSRAKMGVVHLLSTYQRHPSVLAQLNVCISNITLQLEKNKKYLMGHEGSRKENLQENLQSIRV